MLRCWEYDPVNRSPFSAIVESFSQYLDGLADYLEVGCSLTKSPDNIEEFASGTTDHMEFYISGEKLPSEKEVLNMPKVLFSIAEGTSA